MMYGAHEIPPPFFNVITYDLYVFLFVQAADSATSNASTPGSTSYSREDFEDGLEDDDDEGNDEPAEESEEVQDDIDDVSSAFLLWLSLIYLPLFFPLILFFTLLSTYRMIERVWR